jgi:uncharacterized protein YsxB (DUF464 family)
LIRITFENIGIGVNGLAEFRCENVSFAVEGHFSLDKGSDIYCAGVSAIVQSCVASLSKLGISQKFERREGYLKSSMTIEDDMPALKEAKAIVGVMITGVSLMASLAGSKIEIFHLEG